MTFEHCASIISISITNSKMKAYRDLKTLIAPVSPLILDRIKQIVEDSEKVYRQKPSEAQDSYLWEHTLHVASIAHQICRREHIDSLAPVIAAFFHDAGKFHEGDYHEDETAEEEVAASLAQKILTEEGVNKTITKAVTDGLTALYNEDVPDTEVSDIVHDADFLAKTGHLGVANFFIKGTLRGQILERSLIQSLSQELTYVSVLPENMRTSAGRKMASGKRPCTLRFFRNLLDELSEHGIGRFHIEETSWPCPADPSQKITLQIVLPEECPECGGRFTTEYSSEKGIKCTKLLADVRCEQCPNTYHISFCLPEICS